MKDELIEVRKRLLSAKSLTVLSGAGISAESGIPTFRGKEGLWNKHRAEDLATPEAFQRDPKLVWAWYQWRRVLIATKNPNAAHEALVTLETKAASFSLITQNVDGLHTKAGSRLVIELHGNIWKMCCTACGRKTENHAASLSPLPCCETCQGLLRPDIVWFGEDLDPDNLNRSLDACRNADVMLIIGTSGVVQPAASFASIAKEAGAFVVEINPQPVLSYLADLVFSEKAAVLLPQVIA
ncbi:MAG: NAD-dependent deacylase [Nitrospirae bacterium]|nr:NAD-dependent deacylase [Candidatus Manganitrophaceae bacterium]